MRNVNRYLDGNFDLKFAQVEPGRYRSRFCISRPTMKKLVNVSVLLIVEFPARIQAIKIQNRVEDKHVAAFGLATPHGIC